MNTELTNVVSAAGDRAQYDTSAKRLLANKKVLAHILVKTVDEFKGMDPKDVVQYIEGEPFIESVPLDPGLTNAVIKENIIGMNVEDPVINEGLARFDIVFFVRTKDDHSKIIVNVEAQKDDPSGYCILNRAFFYTCRHISSQKEREFHGDDYDSIKPVYSIWICMNMPEDSFNHYHMTDDVVMGTQNWKGKEDMLNVILIGLAKELPDQDESHYLHRLLGTLLSQNLSANEKIEILEAEYDLPRADVGKDVIAVSNLAEGIFEKGLAEGRKATIIKALEKSRSVEEIADFMDCSVEEVEAIKAELLTESVK
jgi:hypothetical protein